MKKRFAQQIFSVIRSRPHQLKDSQMEYIVRGADHSGVRVSDYDDGVWISIHRQGAHAGIPLTREQAEQLRDAIIAFLETSDAAQ
jgi:hypothetical protein